MLVGTVDRIFTYFAHPQYLSALDGFRRGVVSGRASLFTRPVLYEHGETPKCTILLNREFSCGRRSDGTGGMRPNFT